MTSTLLAVVVTPVLTWLLVGQTVTVSVGAMLLSLVAIVLLSMLLGMRLNTDFSRRLGQLQSGVAVVSTLVISLGLAIVMALNQAQLATTGLVILAAVVLLNLIGLLSCDWIPYWLGCDRTTCRTLSLEVGMQNSGLSFALALQYFFAPGGPAGTYFQRLAQCLRGVAGQSMGHLARAGLSQI